MFELADSGHTLNKEEYKKRVPELRTRLLEVQNKLLNDYFPVLVLISGVDGGDKSEIINLLNECMDPRHIETHAFDLPSEDEQKRRFKKREQISYKKHKITEEDYRNRKMWSISIYEAAVDDMVTRTSTVYMSRGI